MKTLTQLREELARQNDELSSAMKTLEALGDGVQIGIPAELLATFEKACELRVSDKPMSNPGIRA